MPKKPIRNGVTTIKNLLLILSLFQVACSMDATLFTSLKALPDTPSAETPDSGIFVTPYIYAPATTNHLSHLKTYVHGDGLVSYKYKIGFTNATTCSDDAGYSSEIPVSTTINEPLSTDGVEYRICVIGKTATDLWTPYDSASSSTWLKDSRLSLPYGIGGNFSRTIYDGTDALYTIMGSMGVAVYDISNPSDFQLLGMYEVTEGYTQDIALVGTTLYISHDNDGSGGGGTPGGIDVVDVSDKGKPRKIRFVQTASDAQALNVSAGFLYVGEENHLEIFDISDPTAPSFVGQLGTLKIENLVKAGNYVYAAGSGAALRVYNVTTPSAPTLIGSYAGTGNSRALAIAGTTAFVADGSVTRAIDISNPAAPTFMSSLSTGYANSITISGTQAIVAANSKFTILDISNPASLSSLGEILKFYAQDVVDLGSSYLLVSDEEIGTYDLTTPASPVLLSTEATFGGNWISSIYADDDDHYVYLGDAEAVVVLDITDRSLPEIVHIETSLPYVVDIKKNGNNLYVVNSSGLSILDVSAPESPTALGSWASPSSLVGLEVLTNSLAVVASYSTLYTVDISDPSNPIPLGNLVLSCVPAALVASGNFAYVGCGGSLEIIDISNASLPSLLSTTAVSIEDLAISDGYVYIATGSDVAVYDVSTPSAPSLTTTVPTASQVVLSNGTAYGIEVRDGYLYVADWDFVSVIDVRNPQSPALLSYYDIGATTDGSIWRVWPTQKSLMIADGYYGFRLINIGDPSLPQAK